MQDSVATNRAWASARTFAGVDYFRKVLAVSPGNLIGYWPMDDDPGSSVAIDYSGRDNDGAYTSVPLGQAGIGDRRTSALFDGSVSFNNIYSAALNTDFDGAEGTLMAWAKVSGADVWTDGVQRLIVNLFVDANNSIYIRKDTNNNQFRMTYEAGATIETDSSAYASTDWSCFVITWSAPGDAVSYYLNGLPAGGTDTGLGTWAGNLSPSDTVIGAGSTVPIQVWDGEVAHVALWTTPLSAARIAELAVP